MKRDLYGSAISAGIVTRRGDGSVHYDTNITVKTTFDNGVTQLGSHGRYAKFSDTRTRPLVGNTNDYELSLVRGTVTTNEIPLYCALPSKLITENGVQQWEVTAEPGIACTWTGPVYTTNTGTGFTTATEYNFAAYPTIGCIPYFVGNQSTTNFAFRPSGFLDCSTLGSSSDAFAIDIAARLTSLFNSAGLTTVSVTAPQSVGVTQTTLKQQYTIVNTSPTITVYLDFSFPSTYAQYNFDNATKPSKAGILQACKLLGFVPGQIFSILPSSTTLLPRAFQLAFRSTIDMYAYKAVRWTPEDTAATFPTQANVDNNDVGTYFDTYDYSFFLNECVNPAFRRCIFDEFDTNVILSEQCLQRQIKAYCSANCAATTYWSSGTSYVTGNSVVYLGNAYIALQASLNNVPTDTSIFWKNCGASINYSYIPGKTYKLNDTVTYPATTAGITRIYTAQATTSGAPSGTAVTVNSWFNNDSFNSSLLVPNQPAISTLPPTITYNASTQSFVLNLDSYGFGGTIYANADDGYFGLAEDPLFPQTPSQQIYNSSLNDIARDSWGITGTYGITTFLPYTVARHPYAAFDERCVIEADDYFHQLFGNWQCARLTYTDPRTNLTTAYVRYTPQALSAGLSVTTALPLTSVAPSTAGLAATYLPYGRLGGTVPYIYTFPQDYSSIGLAWNPVDALVVITGNVPIEDDQTLPPYILTDSGPPSAQQTNGNTLKILAELNVKPIGQTYSGQEYRAQVVYDPTFPVTMELQGGRIFNQFDFQIFMRMKASQALRPLSLSNGGSVNLRWLFGRK